MKKQQSENVSKSPMRAVSVNRCFDVSAEQAFEAWTPPALLEQWFGPRDFGMKVLSHELKVGGRWRFLMDDGDTVSTA